VRVQEEDFKQEALCLPRPSRAALRGQGRGQEDHQAIAEGHEARAPCFAPQSRIGATQDALALIDARP
jgi:hypothetical protein